jgi:aminoglycoside N3'-acetyltransferase
MKNIFIQKIWLVLTILINTAFIMIIIICLSNEYTMSLNYYEESIVYEDIYTILNEYLQEKFSKIIFDWSVTKFVYLKEVMPKLLTLLEPNGELFINSFKFGGMIYPYTFKKISNKYYLYDINNNKINLNDASIINDIIYYRSNNLILINYNDRNMKVHNIEELSKHVDEDGGIALDILEKHISNKENIKIENDNYIKNVKKDYEEIIDCSKFSFNFIDSTYPNESNREETNVNGFF